MSVEFSTTQAGQITSTTARMLAHWDRTGLAKPSGKRAHGKGSRRRYTFGDLVAIQTVRRLRIAGCPLQKIRAAVDYIRKHHPETSGSDVLARLTLVTDGIDVFLVTNGDQLMEVVTRQMVWCVPLGRLIRETIQAVKSAPLKWTEDVTLGDRQYTVVVARDGGVDEYSARCRELPGLLVRGRSPDETVCNATVAIAEVVEHTVRQTRRRLRESRAG